MKAAFIEELKKPLVVKEIPDIPELGPNEVLIKQELTGVCYRDILTAEGFFPRIKLPLIPGHEIAGTIVKTGSSVKDFKEGDYVASLIYIPCGQCKYCKAGMENICRNKRTYGEDVQGSYAGFVKAHENSLVKIPKDVPIEDAVISACVTGMLVHAIKDRADLKKEENVFVTGAGGGVGIHAVQISKAFGAKVIALTSSDWKAKKIKEYGADEVIVASGNVADKVKALTNGEGADLVIDTVGEPTFEQSVRSVRWGGRIIVIGNVNVKPVSLNLGLIILREVSILGNLSSTKRNILEAIELTRKGKIKAVIHSIYDLDRVNEVHDMMKNKSSLGRVLLKVS
ncbi:MAG TPA: alcohol dehydrogenase catalytic domain-containing protein [Geobacterales bacterium]|nr:alcohol dehydrogenase catalytic domain-containing protein [Geobacterales bacterium]